MTLLNHSQTPTIAPLKFGMDKRFLPSHYNGCNYLSMMGLKLIHVSKRGPWSVSCVYGVFHMCCFKKPVVEVSKFAFVIFIARDISAFKVTHNDVKIFSLNSKKHCFHVDLYMLKNVIFGVEWRKKIWLNEKSVVLICISVQLGQFTTSHHAHQLMPEEPSGVNKWQHSLLTTNHNYAIPCLIR